MQKLLFILGELSDDDVDWIVATGEREVIEPQTVLIKEGASLQKLYILLEGRLQVSVEDKVVAVLGSGEVFGEVSFVDARPPSATVTAVDSCVVLSLSWEALNRKLKQDVGFSSTFYRTMCLFLADRLRLADTHLNYSILLTHGDDLFEQADPTILDNYSLGKVRYGWLLSRLRGAKDDFAEDFAEDFALEMPSGL
ncbi:cyclic nucleotide-binding domain-containing protein [Prochlorothrix hollandica]|uniref:cyclic nucleotide-binding domain-containing protein n=1 Tax=Prochlorothrix hollandica TaxID=1223 RepID=UPI003341C80E